MKKIADVMKILKGWCRWQERHERHIGSLEVVGFGGFKTKEVSKPPYDVTYNLQL